MKCKCGNEQGKPLVSPRPITFKMKGEEVKLHYTGGMSTDGKCWFCSFPHGVPVLTEEQAEMVRVALSGD